MQFLHCCIFIASLSVHAVLIFFILVQLDSDEGLFETAVLIFDDIITSKGGLSYLTIAFRHLYKIFLWEKRGIFIFHAYMDMVRKLQSKPIEEASMKCNKLFSDNSD